MSHTYKRSDRELGKRMLLLTNEMFTSTAGFEESSFHSLTPPTIDFLVDYFPVILRSLFQNLYAFHEAAVAC